MSAEHTELKCAGYFSAMRYFFFFKANIIVFISSTDCGPRLQWFYYQIPCQYISNHMTWAFILGSHLSPVRQTYWLSAHPERRFSAEKPEGIPRELKGQERCPRLEHWPSTAALHGAGSRMFSKKCPWLTRPHKVRKGHSPGNLSVSPTQCSTHLVKNT